MLKRALRRRRLRVSLNKTMSRSGQPVFQGRGYSRTDIVATACTALLELTSAKEVADRLDVIHACAQMCPRLLARHTFHDLSPHKTLLVLQTVTGNPCAAAITRWYPDECYLEVICASVKASGRALFHYIMCICDGRGLPFLRLVSVPQLINMYVLWGRGSAVEAETDVDIGFFVFNVAAYFSKVEPGSIRHLEKHGMQFYISENKEYDDL